MNVRRSSGRRTLAAAVALAVVAVGGAAPVVPAAAAGCSITWEGAGTTYSALSPAVAAAPATTTILVTGTCPATTTIGKQLTIQGTQKRRAARLISTGDAPTLSVTDGSLRLVNITVEGRSGDCSNLCFGGSLSVFNGSADVVNATLIGSRVTSGGGLYLYSGSVRLLGGTIVRDGFGTAQVTGRGGAIGIAGGTLTIAGRTQVIGSRASEQGGAISVYSAALFIRGKAQVRGNRTTVAGAGGGGISAESSFVAISGSARITGNRSWGGAGIRLLDGTALSLAGKALVSGNRADVTPSGASDLGGAGILADGASITIRIDDDARITQNRSLLPGSGGGIRMATGTVLEVDGNPVSCSSAALRAHVFDNTGGNCVTF